MAGGEEVNIANSRSVQLTTFSVLLNEKKKKLEEMLKNNDYVDDFEIEELDKEDVRKEVFIVLKNPIDIKYASDIITKEIFN